MTSPANERSAALVAQITQWMLAQEGEHFEFKEAKNRFQFEDLAKYCCALANEGGGKVILGVSDRRPRKIVGTGAFQQPEDTRRSLMERIPLRIQVLEIAHPDGRVLVFDVPSRPLGVPIKYDRIYWSREADSLVPIGEDKLRAIFSEAGHDYSADVCPGASLEDLDATAIEDFRRRWIDKSNNEALDALSHEQLLRDAEVVVDGGVTYAALILFGTSPALGKFLAQAEVVFEYRSSEEAGPAQQRKEYRQGFFTFYDDLWSAVNLRNDMQHYRDGLFVLDIPTFAERSVREAVLNAVSHRDYQLGGNVFVRQYPRRLMIESPGGFPLGITTENVLDRQSPRNRRIADVFTKCGLVERSGQGMNLMFEQSIRDGKPRPDFAGTDSYHVVLTLHGEVRDPRFVEFLNRVGQETLSSFNTHDFLILDLVHREAQIPAALQPRLRRLAELGVVESLGRGKGTRYLLSRRFYALIGKRGAYTRRKGLDRETNKTLLVKHIQENQRTGATLEELSQVLPSLSLKSVQWLVRQLKLEKRIRVEGRTRGARWFPLEEAEQKDKR
jgi:ATP-dependent DNA helicase RecG